MAVLTVTIKEELTLNGFDRGSVNTIAIDSVTQSFNRIVTCPASVDTTVAMFQDGANTQDGALGLQDVKYVRVTNLDSANSVNLSLQVSAAENGTADSSCSVLLEAGKSFMMGAVHDGIAVDDDAATIVTTLTDLESIIVDPSTNEVTVEVFIAS
jgi:hypothetical protein